MGFREVKKELVKLDKDALIKHISELYKKYKPVKSYFDFYVNPNEDEVLATYKNKVREGFFPKRGFDLKLSISRKAINDFKKLGVSPDALADVLLYYVECGVEFTNEFGDISESFYTSLENTFENALKLMHEHSILYRYKVRASKVVEATSHIGWGFHDYLDSVYLEFYDEI